MNTSEVVEMIDAITEGRDYTYSLSDTDIFEFKGDRVKSTYKCGHGFTFDDARTAREIAGALVAWANHRDGVSLAEMKMGIPHTEATTEVYHSMQLIKPRVVDQFVDDPANHPIDCTCIFCIPGV